MSSHRTKPRILTIIGARPQYIKAAMVSRAFRRRGDVEEILVDTGQHYDPEMSEIFYAEFGLAPPRHNLGIHGGSHAEMTGRMLAALEPVFLAERPDAVLVYGDTNSTLSAALLAAKLNRPIAHVEAGMRSFNRAMPEEVNRVLTDHVSSLLFCSTTTAVHNLAREGIREGVHHVGEVMYDAVRAMTGIAAREPSPTLAALDLAPGGYLLATVHRQANTETGEALARVVDFLRSREFPVVLPLHPRTEGAAARFGVSLEGLRIARPVGYLEMTRLVSGARAVLTDSGGVQKEAYFHGVPCVTMRDETEWVETIEAGWNRLWHTEGYRPRHPIAEYGTGDAADGIAATLHAFLAVDRRRI